MRIAFVSTMGGSPWGGSEALWSAAATAALAQGHQVLVSVYNWGVLPPTIKALKEAGAELHFRPLYDPNQSVARKTYDFLIRKVCDAAAPYRRIIDYSPDHVVISQGDSFDLLIHHAPLGDVLVTQKIPFSLICHSHEQYGFIPDQRIYPKGRELFGRAKNIFVVSQRMGALLQRRLCANFNTIRFTWNPLNLARHECLPWPASSTMRFAIIGSLDYRKGADTAFECLAAEQWQERDWSLNLYGDGYGRAYLEDLALYFGISKRVHFHGHVSSIENVWQENHLLLIPSAGEGMPITLIEACMCGRPAVATDVGGVTEIIQESLTGYCADAPTVSSFSRALERAWTERGCWQDLGRTAHSQLKGQFTCDPALELLKTLI